MPEITDEIEYVDIEGVVQLFNQVNLKDICRPIGKVDLLIGLSHAALYPMVVAK